MTVFLRAFLCESIATAATNRYWGFEKTWEPGYRQGATVDWLWSLPPAPPWFTVADINLTHMVASADVIVIAFHYNDWWSFNRNIRHNALGYYWLWLFRLAHIDYPYSISGFELDVFHIVRIFRNGNAIDRKRH
jgi:hypothetical protein